MSNDARAGAPNGQDYGAQQTYQPAPQYPSMNGIAGTKRMRDDDDGPYGRPMSASGDLKRQRTDPGAMTAPQPVKAGGPRR